MTLAPEIRRELCDLLGALRDERLDAAGLARLDAIVTADAAARRFYRNYVDLCVSLHWAAKDREPTLSRREADNVAFPPIVVDVSPASREPFLSRLFTPGGFVFSYGASAVLLLIAVLIGWSLKVSHDNRVERIVLTPRPLSSPAQADVAPTVARVTNAADCRWAKGANSLSLGDAVSQNKTISLATGLLEITYDTGAKVILQGPCAYQVSSARGGFLSVGRLTARIVASGEWPVASKEGTGSRDQGAGLDISHRTSLATSHPPLATDHPPLATFTIHTPTAIVTDLGTEFGVEVDRSGETRSHVYRGHVELRPARVRGRAATGPIILDAGQSARVKSDGKGPTAIVREPWSGSERLVRRIPRLASIRLFNTGVRLADGEIDRHWRLVRRSDLPAMKPRPLGVSGVDPGDWMFLTNDPARSQWLTVATADQSADVNVVYTIRTTFELAGDQTRSTGLRGRFLVCNEVKAIRLNGVAVAVPKHDPLPPFKSFHPFSVDKGFVEGANTLEFDVIRASQVNSRTGQRFVFPVVAIRAELLGVSTRDPKTEPEKERRK